MSIQTINYTFSENLKVTNELVFKFNKALEYDVFERICETYNTKSITEDTLNEIIKDLINIGYYGWHHHGKSSLLYNIVDTIFDIKEFGFNKISEDWSDDGADDYVSYQYVDSTSVIRDAKSQIENQITLLKKYGIKADISYS